MNKKRILISVIGLIIISLLFITEIVKNQKEYIMFDKTLLALTLDNDVITSFPKGGIYHVDVKCINGTGKYQPVRKVNANGLETNEYEMKFTVENIAASGVKCYLDFVTIKNDNKSNYTLNSEVENKATANLNGYRYTGKQPDNWIWFNDEKWRIIGSVPTTLSDGTTIENRVKIIRAEPIGGLAYNNSDSNVIWGGTGNNDESTLYTLLNTKYYGKLDATGASPCYGAEQSYALCNYTNIGISNNSSDYYGKMIERVYMNVGSVSTVDITIDEVYTKELTALTTTPVKIGMMTASDYGYASGYSSIKMQALENYVKDNWLYGIGSEYTMTRYAGNLLFLIIQGDLSNCGATNSMAVRPVVYLSPDIYIISGNGSEAEPYIIAKENL